MRFYDIFMFPLEKRVLWRLRARLIPKAKGNVLELGAGTGVNLPHYDAHECHTLTTVDKAEGRFSKAPPEGLDITTIEADAENLPFSDDTFDTVVETLLLCSVENVPGILSEISRVLKPGGRFIHIDHGLPEGRHMQKLFRRMAPLWHGLTGSCRIDKIYAPMLEAAGFVQMASGRAGADVFYWGEYKIPKDNQT
jgi:ubiquinone/menaquinone biosynthesis C-methylase UbiE